MKTQTFVRRPFYVEAVQVTEQNMEDVRKWANGQLRVTKQEPTAKYIYIHVRLPLVKKQTQAFVGDWVLRTVSEQNVVSFKIYGDEAFRKAFILSVPVQQDKEVRVLPGTFSHPTPEFRQWAMEQGEDLFSPPVGQDSETVKDSCD